MIYLEEKFNLIPASPVTLEEFVKFAQKQLVPVCEHLGARLIAGWYTNTEWYSQVTQIMEFDDMEEVMKSYSECIDIPEWLMIRFFLQIKRHKFYPDRLNRYFKVI